MATWRNGYAEDCKSLTQQTSHYNIPIKEFIIPKSSLQVLS